MQNDQDLLDLQTTLRLDADGTARRAMEAEFATWRQDWKRRLDDGLSPTDFATATALVDAVDAAGETVASVWRRYHGG